MIVASRIITVVLVDLTLSGLDLDSRPKSTASMTRVRECERISVSMAEAFPSGMALSDNCVKIGLRSTAGI